MKQNSIPAEVKRLAESVYSREVVHLGKVGASEVYGEKSGEEETPAPTGLPIVITWDGNHAESVEGTEALELLSRL